MAANAGHKLDDPALYTSLDPTGLRQRLRDLPLHCMTAWSAAQAISLPEQGTPTDKVVIGGMGGSAIAGDLAADLASIQQAVPIIVVRDFRLPFPVDAGTLFIPCSYSGNTEETLSMFDQAVRARAKMIAIAGGGALAHKAGDEGIPLLTVDIESEPRSAVAYNLMALLGVLRRVGLVKIEEGEVSAAVESLSQSVSELCEDVPVENNQAKQLAVQLTDKVILVYGSGLFSAMARRWKSQFNENSKAWAFSEEIPELLHNSVEAYGSSFPSHGQLMALLLQPVAGEADHPLHHTVVSELLLRNGIPHRVLLGKDCPPLSQLLSMLAMGDYVSYYLALLRGIDPSPNPSITAAKELLANLPEVTPSKNLGDQRGSSDP